MAKLSWLVNNKLVLFCIGLLMGPFSSYLFIDILHLPVVVPEVVFIPYFFLFYRRLGLSFRKKVSFWGVICLWFIFLLFALIWATWSLMAILSTARSFLILGLFYCIGSKITFNASLLRVILIVSIGSIVGWVVKSILNFTTLQFLSGSEESVVYGNMIAIAFVFAISLLSNNKFYTLIFVFATNIVLSFTTALRRQIAVSILSLLLSLFILTIKHSKYSYFFIIVLLSIPLYLSLPQIEEFVADNSPNMHARIFDRSQRLLEGDLGNSEKSRVDAQNLIFNEFFDLIAPHGYVSQQTAKDANTGIYNDIPLYMLAYTFGVLLLFPYLLFLVYRLWVMFRSFLLYGDVCYGILFVVGAVMLFLHFIDSQMFTVSYSAPFTGLTLGLMFRQTIIKGTSNYKL